MRKSKDIMPENYADTHPWKKTTSEGVVYRIPDYCRDRFTEDDWEYSPRSWDERMADGTSIWLLLRGTNEWARYTCRQVEGEEWEYDYRHPFRDQGYLWKHVSEDGSVYRVQAHPMWDFRVGKGTKEQITPASDIYEQCTHVRVHNPHDQPITTLIFFTPNANPENRHLVHLTKSLISRYPLEEGRDYPVDELPIGFIIYLAQNHPGVNRWLKGLLP